METMQVICEEENSYCFRLSISEGKLIQFDKTRFFG